MKKLSIIIIALISVFTQAYSQDTTRTSLTSRYYVDSLTTTKDTIDFQFNMDVLRADKISIFATSSAVDTAQVFVNSPDGVRWAQVGVVDMADDSVRPNIEGVTATKELVVNSYNIHKVRIISSSNDGSVLYLVVAVKRSTPYEY